MIEYKGLQFEAQPGGGLLIRVRHDATENAEIVRTVLLEMRDVLDVIGELGYHFEAAAPSEPEQPQPQPESLTDQVADILGELGETKE